MTITEFLEARIAEDEAVALAASYEPDPDYPVESDDPWGRLGEFAGRGGRLFTHVLRHDPARALAECKAKREIIRHLTTYQDAIVAWQGFPVNDPDPESEWRQLPFRTLAAIYADHPDYRQEWAQPKGATNGI